MAIDSGGSSGSSKPTTYYVAADKLQYNGLSNEEIAIIKIFFSTKLLNIKLISFLNQSRGIKISLNDEIIGARYYEGTGEIVLGKKTDGTIEYSNLFEETAHFLQDELGIMAQKDGMKGHSNIEYQAKIMSAIMSLGVSSSKEDIITN